MSSRRQSENQLAPATNLTVSAIDRCELPTRRAALHPQVPDSSTRRPTRGQHRKVLAGKHSSSCPSFGRRVALFNPSTSRAPTHAHVRVVSSAPAGAVEVPTPRSRVIEHPRSALQRRAFSCATACDLNPHCECPVVVLSS